MMATTAPLLVPVPRTPRGRKILDAFARMKAEGIVVNRVESRIVIMDPDEPFEPKVTGIGTFFHLFESGLSRRNTVREYLESDQVK